MALFNEERLTIDNLDEKITFPTFLGGLWPRSPFMLELARKTSLTSREFVFWANDFVNDEDMLKISTDLRKAKLDNAKKRGRKAPGAESDQQTKEERGREGRARQAKARKWFQHLHAKHKISAF